LREKLGALIMTLGFEPGPLVSAMAANAAEGFEPGAEIMVFTPSFKDERAERAWRELQNVFSMMSLRDVSLRRLVVNLSDFTSAVLQVKKVFADLRGRRVKISLTGGMRALVLAVFVAYLTTRWERVPEVEVFLEGRGEALRIPRLAAALGPRVGERKLRVLSFMRPSITYRIGDLAGLLPQERSTIYRHLKSLAEVGLVERVDGTFKITDLGLILRNAE